MNATNSGPLDISEISVVPVRSIADLRCETCRAIYGYWEALMAAGGAMSFDPINVPEAIPYLVILDLENDVSGFRFRMSGQAIVAASGLDLTGQLLDKTGRDAPLTLKFCDAVVEAKAPVFSNDSFSVEFPGRTRRFKESLALPLFGEGGELSRVLLVHGPEV